MGKYSRSFSDCSNSNSCIIHILPKTDHRGINCRVDQRMKKKALFLAGGWEGHEPQETSRFISNEIEKYNIESEIINDLDILGEKNKLEKYDIILPVWTMGKIEDNNWNLKNSKIGNLQEVIYSGVGLAGWHGGMGDAFRDNTNYQFLVGSQFVCHPGDFVDYEVIIKDSKHEITRGLDNFKVHSEQYFLHYDPSVEIIASTKFDNKYHEWIDGVEMPIAYTKKWGNGNIFYCSIGHYLKDFENVNVLKMISQGINWAVR